MAILWIVGLSILGGIGYVVVYYFHPRIPLSVRVVAWVLSIAVVILWILFDFYYIHLYDHWAWLFEIRAIWGIEFTAFFIGVFCAMLQRTINNKRLHEDLFSRHNGILLLFVLIVPPFIKPILHQVQPSWIYQWKDGVSIQSEGYTCGPASVATILHHYGIETSEEEVSRNVYLTSHGTEPWYLARYLRLRELRVRFVPVLSNPRDLPVPCIAAVRLGGKNGVGHFLTVLEKTDASYTFGNPLGGRFEWTKDFTPKNYYFVGIVLHVYK